MPSSFSWTGVAKACPSIELKWSEKILKLFSNDYDLIPEKET